MSKMGNLLVRAQECPHIMRKSVYDSERDDAYSYDLCKINSKFCLLESELKCPYFEEIKEEWAGEKEPDGEPEDGSYICDKCGKATVLQAIKCENPDCGKVFIIGSVPNDFQDRCPECKYSKTEEIRNQRKAGGQ